MTTNPIQRTARLFVLSAFLVLAAFSFLAFSAGSAHALSHPAGAAQKVKTAKIIDNPGAVFSPAAITVKSGSTVRIVNKTPYSLIIFTNQGTGSLPAGASTKMTVTQSQYVRICGGGTLSITVVLRTTALCRAHRHHD
jgi:plastocyanin